MSFMMSPDERAYSQVTTPWDGEVPNSTGTATLANGDALKHISVSLEAVGGVIPNRAKTGSRSRLTGQIGRRMANFEIEVPLMGSGTAGTAPDADPIWEALFGKAGTVSPATSVTYDFADVVSGLSLWVFNDPSAANTFDRVMGGGVVNGFEINPNPGDVATMRVSGQGVYVANKPNFASLDTGGKMGLSSWPTEPASPTYAGTEIPGDLGSFTLNSVSTFKLQSWTIRGNLGRNMRHAPQSGYYPVVTSQGNRDITLDVSLYLENTSDLAALRHLAYTKGSHDGAIVIGETAGSILTLNCNDMVIPTEQIADTEAEQIITLSGMQLNATSSAVVDELTAVWT